MSVWRQLRAIGPLPGVATIVIPAAVLGLTGSVSAGWDLRRRLPPLQEQRAALDPQPEAVDRGGPWLAWRPDERRRLSCRRCRSSPTTSPATSRRFARRAPR